MCFVSRRRAVPGTKADLPVIGLRRGDGERAETFGEPVLGPVVPLRADSSSGGREDDDTGDVDAASGGWNGGEIGSEQLAVAVPEGNGAQC